MGLPSWKTTPLMSLPLELRLEIWEWTLTDPSASDLTVNISRAQNHCYKPISSGGAPTPRVATSLHPPKNHPIGLSLLRTNHLIYEEALPLLYRSVTFAPEDHQGIFPLWLASLSPFARSLIRSVKLRVPQQIYDTDFFGDPAVPLFHWAVTCAQVAKLSGGLRRVEVEGLRIESEELGRKVRRSVVFPLCKIKARKVFGRDDEQSVGVWWREAEKELEGEMEVRRKQAEVRAVAEAEEVAKRGGGSQESGSEKVLRESTRGENEWYRSVARRGVLESYPETSERSIDRDLSRMPGIKVFERELAEHTLSMVHHCTGDSRVHAGTEALEDWDVISPPRGRPPSYTSRRQSSDSWSDAASTIAEAQSWFKDDVGEDGGQADSKSFLWV